MHLFAACTRLLLLTDAFIDSSTLRGGTLSVWYSWTVGTIPKEHIQMKDKDWEINVWIESAVIYPHPDMWYVISNQTWVCCLPHWATGPCIVQGREEELLYFTPRVLIMHRASGRLHAAASGPRSPAPPQPSTRQPSIGDKVDDMSVCSGDCGH